MNRISKVYNRLFFGRHTLYPPRCALCGRVGNDGRDLCSNCLADLPRIGQYCHRCGVPLTDNATLCGPCSHAPPPFESSTIPFRYAPPLDYLLLQMKFHQRLHLAPLLGCLLAEAVTSRGTPLPELLLPVPLHHSRLRKRGYNQALELVRCLAHELSLPFACNRIVRQRHTPAQTSLRGKERRKNLRDAFRTNGDLPRHIALVDDVVTTGATVTEVAKTLKRAGVEIIEIWAIARAGGD